jgi:hypothetical protein
MAAAYDCFLALGQNTIFKMLTEMQKFTSSVVYGQVCPPKLWWSNDLCKVSVDGETLELDTFRLGIQQMLNDT